MAFLLLVVLLFLFLIGFPIGFSVAATAVLAIYIEGIPLVAAMQRMYSGVDNFTFLAVPFFVLAAELMNQGGITRRLVDFATFLVGHITGGLGHVAVVTNMIMAGMSGSAIADAAGTGSILIPAMRQKGFDPAFSAALIASASTVGPIIPPSIPFVIFGMVANVSVGRLFFAGALPGLLMGLFMMVVTYIVARRRRYPREERPQLKELTVAFVKAFPALIMPIIVLGGILGGVVTPTEAAAAAALYAFLAGGLIYRELTPARIWSALLTTFELTATVGIIVAAASALGWITTLQEIPQNFAAAVGAVSEKPLVVLLVINVLLLVLGCFMETISLILILGPILMPLVVALHVDPVHFGLVMVLNLMIGLVTPPFGMSMFVLCKISGVSMVDFVREALPFYLALLIVLALVTIFPAISLTIPDLLLGKTG